MRFLLALLVITLAGCAGSKEAPPPAPRSGLTDADWERLDKRLDNDVNQLRELREWAIELDPWKFAQISAAVVFVLALIAWLIYHRRLKVPGTK